MVPGDVDNILGQPQLQASEITKDGRGEQNSPREGGPLAISLAWDAQGWVVEIRDKLASSCSLFFLIVDAIDMCHLRPRHLVTFSAARLYSPF